VLVHVSGGRELALKPDLNIIGIVHPRGPREVISGDMVVVIEMGDSVVWVGLIMTIVELPMSMVEPESPISLRFAMPDMIIDVGLIADIWFARFCPSPGPAWSMYSGRHSTLP